MSKPEFTFCVPNLNKIQYLPACIESMLAQDCSDWKCVFVDGYSTDGSWEYMQQFNSDSRFLIRRGIKQGMYADWNECLKRVDTEYFYILTSDDTCFPSLVSTTVRALDQYTDIDACHFQYAFIDETGQIIQSPEEITRSFFALYCDVNKFMHRRSGICEFMMHFAYRTIYTTITSLVFRRRLIDKMQGFRTIYGSSGDFDWTMRLGLFTDILYIPKLLATWRRYAGQATLLAPILASQKAHISIAQNNLRDFIGTEQAQALLQPVNPHRLLEDFFNRHASILLQQTMTAKTARNAIHHAFPLIMHYPLYIPKKLINRISFNKLYPYSNSMELAQEYIRDYGLKWPPLQIKS